MKTDRKPQTAQSQNVYKAARLAAAKTNSELDTVEKACYLVSINREKLGQIEQEDRRKLCAVPNSDEVAQMIRVYHAPELRNHYCVNECPLGAGIQPLEHSNLDRISIQLLVSLQRIEQLRDELGNILVDGQVAEPEREKFLTIVQTLKSIATHAGSLELWAQKNGLLP